MTQHIRFFIVATLAALVLAASVFSQAADPRVDQADSLRLAKDYSGALKLIDDVFKAGKQDSYAYNMRGLIRLDNTQYGLALPDFSEAIRLSPRIYNYYVNRALVYNLIAPPNYSAAIADCTIALQLEPGFKDAWVQRGWAEIQLGQWEAAERDYTEAIRLGENRIFIYQGRTHIRYNLHHYADAVADAHTAIALDPNDANAIRNLKATVDAETAEIDALQTQHFAAPSNAQITAQLAVAVSKMDTNDVINMLNPRLEVLREKFSANDRVKRFVIDSLPKKGDADYGTICQQIDLLKPPLQAVRDAVHTVFFVTLRGDMPAAQAAIGGINAIFTSIADEEAAIKQMRSDANCDAGTLPAAKPAVTLTASVQKVTVACPGSSTCKTSPPVTVKAQDQGFTGEFIKVKFSVTGGGVRSDGLVATWDLSGVAPGTYAITAEVTDDDKHLAYNTTYVTVENCPCKP